MLNFFKRKTKSSLNPQVIKDLKKIITYNSGNLHINLYVDDQILFQVVPAKHYSDRFMNNKDHIGFMELHFFNKKKTLTSENELAVKKLYNKGELCFIEPDKNWREYYATLGKDADHIIEVIENRIFDTYHNIALNRISFEFAEYEE